ncbi:hypothetical protein [Cohnella lupini]|uniref:peptidylprolyl isomerase n=1 Tax=Cohnella lupini TaxID=1294267 RepID=A0A3D9IPZ6_9BACL|nr:hypothetical protein [Cohnella lupini]RED63863.1 hypothetical protein DFP95_103103 [Cohnella lupini]
MKLKGMVALILTLFSIVLLSIYYVSARPHPERTPVADVNGSPITARELENELMRQRAGVIDYFRQTYGAEYGKDFWETDYNGETPGSVARNWALQSLVRTRLELELAQSYGLIRGTSYEDLLLEMDKENKRRRAAVQANEPVYGPVKFDESFFLNYFLSHLRIELKEKLSEKEVKMTDEDLQKHYEQIKDTMFTLEGKVSFEKTAVSYRGEGKGTSAERKLTAKKLAESLRTLVDQGMEVTEAVQSARLQAGNDTVTIRNTDDELTGDKAGAYYRSQPQLYSILSGSLKAGQISAVFDEELLGEYVFIKVKAIEADGYQSFEENKHNVRSSFMDIAYESYLDKLYDKATIEIYEERIDRLKLLSNL